MMFFSPVVCRVLKTFVLCIILVLLPYEHYRKRNTLVGDYSELKFAVYRKRKWVIGIGLKETVRIEMLRNSDKGKSIFSVTRRKD